MLLVVVLSGFLGKDAARCGVWCVVCGVRCAVWRRSLYWKLGVGIVLTTSLVTSQMCDYAYYRPDKTRLDNYETP